MQLQIRATATGHGHIVDFKDAKGDSAEAQGGTVQFVSEDPSVFTVVQSATDEKKFDLHGQKTGTAKLKINWNDVEGTPRYKEIDIIVVAGDATDVAVVLDSVDEDVSVTPVNSAPAAPAADNSTAPAASDGPTTPAAPVVDATAAQAGNATPAAPVVDPNAVQAGTISAPGTDAAPAADNSTAPAAPLTDAVSQPSADVASQPTVDGAIAPTTDAAGQTAADGATTAVTPVSDPVADPSLSQALGEQNNATNTGTTPTA